MRIRVFDPICGGDAATVRFSSKIHEVFGRITQIGASQVQRIPGGMGIETAVFWDLIRVFGPIAS